MPFKSKKQIKKFRMLEAEGKLPAGTTEEWLAETKNVKKLPTRKNAAKKTKKK